MGSEVEGRYREVYQMLKYVGDALRKYSKALPKFGIVAIHLGRVQIGSGHVIPRRRRYEGFIVFEEKGVAVKKAVLIRLTTSTPKNIAELVKKDYETLKKRGFMVQLPNSSIVVATREYVLYTSRGIGWRSYLSTEVPQNFLVDKPLDQETRMVLNLDSTKIQLRFTPLKLLEKYNSATTYYVKKLALGIFTYWLLQQELVDRNIDPIILLTEILK
ncbi:MAG: hypothetical protein DRJ40_00960 [Thermoprotei archaeon]|nr:MAG: hypothetical protein DRJ40_00960 [Thermoprotei archaeon]